MTRAGQYLNTLPISQHRSMQQSVLQSFHMSATLLMPYYIYSRIRNIPQCNTIKLSKQSKHAPTFLKNFNAVTHNTHAKDTKHQLNNLTQYR